MEQDNYNNVDNGSEVALLSFYTILAAESNDCEHDIKEPRMRVIKKRTKSVTSFTAEATPQYAITKNWDRFMNAL